MYFLYTVNVKRICRMTCLQNKVAVVVVTYNRKKILKECIDALLYQDYQNCEIIIVDNASTDGTSEMIKEHFSDNLIYCNTGKNLGGAGGFNYGMKKALSQGCDYIWLMDDDCIVNSTSLPCLLAEAENLKDEFGFLSSQVLWTDGSLCNMNIQKKSYSEKITEEDKKSARIIMATFVSFFVKAETVRKVGLPITEFFIWADDQEYSRRISKQYPCYYVPESTVVHKTKSNLGSNLPADQSKDLSRYFYAYRNEYYLYRNEGIKGKLYYLTKRIYHIAKIFLRSDRKQERLNIIRKAIAEGKRFNPAVEYMPETKREE